MFSLHGFSNLMPSNRYTVVLADRRTGVVRRFTCGVRSAVMVITTVIVLPVLIGLGAAFKARADVADLYASHAALEFENANYHAATDALTNQINALQSAVTDLGSQAALDPKLEASMDKLPAIVKNRAMGGAPTGAALAALTPGLTSPEDTLGLVRDLLQGIEGRLRLVRSDVDKRNQLAAATPSIWPAHGWLSSGAGGRSDPFTGEKDFHPGLDISADKGSPVYATADGDVEQAGFSGAYGNLITLKHGFGLETRYGHLSAIKVKPGQSVKRGDLIGLVGATGRATGPHLHYEVRVNGRILNPLNLLGTARGN
jgi:murein DD-endopeptidase MepM/ murein hydrolase activator NlpD